MLLLLAAALAAGSPVAIPEASPAAAASPVADPIADPAPVASPELPAAAPLPAVETVKQEIEEVAKVQEVAEAPLKPQGRSFDDEVFSNNNDVAKVKPAQADTTTGEEALLRKLNTRCAQKDTSSCVLLKMVTYFNRLLKKSSIAIGETVEIERTTAVSVSAEDVTSSRALEGDSDEDKLTSLMTDKLFNFVRSRSMRLKLLPGADLLVTPKTEKDGGLNLDMSLQANKEEGRGNKAQKAIVPALIAAGAVKIGMLGILAMKALVLLVGKALILSKIAFLVAVAIGLKKLFSQQRHVTYEVVAQPHHGHSSHHESGGHDSYSSGWGRAARALGGLPPPSGDPQELAYRAHH